MMHFSHDDLNSFSSRPPVTFLSPIEFLQVSNSWDFKKRQAKIVSEQFDPSTGIVIQTAYLLNNKNFWVGGLNYTIRLAPAGLFAGSAINDFIVCAEGSSQIFAYAGNDYVRAFAGHDTLWGGTGADTLVGGMGHDVLDGAIGDDLLFAESGDDTLKSLSGSDRLIGGAGNDLFLIGFSAGDRNPQGLTQLSGDAGDDVFQFDFRNGLARSGRSFKIVDFEGQNQIRFLNLDRNIFDLTTSMNDQQQIENITIAERGRAPLFSIDISSAGSVAFPNA
jgi:Ca2+-binding RTX toxin-like protein